MTKSICLHKTETLKHPSGIHFGRHANFAISTILHHHDFMEIFLIVKGRIKHFINNASQELTEGDLVFIRPRDSHCFQMINKESCELINIAFPPSIYHDSCHFLEVKDLQKQLLESATAPQLHLNSHDQNKLVEALEQAAVLMTGQPVKARIRFKKVIMSMIEHFAKEDSESNDSLPEWLDHCCREMKRDKNFLKGTILLKKVACKSEEHLIRSFRKYLNQTPTEFINELRLDYAATLLQTTSEQIGFIAIECGFSNLSHFHHCFKRRFNSTPFQYRKMAQSTIIPIHL